MSSRVLGGEGSSAGWSPSGLLIFFQFFLKEKKRKKKKK